jgi:uncharacterized Zn finger protein
LSPREDSASKARRLLGEGRVTIVHADEGGVAALIRGDSAMTYRVTHAGGEWRCDCAARTRCSHVQAVMLVTTSTPWRSANSLFADEWANEPIQPWEQTVPEAPYRRAP